jgi:hypothetical protein
MYGENNIKIFLCCLKSSGLLPGVIFWFITNVSVSLVSPIFRVLGNVGHAPKNDAG